MQNLENNFEKYQAKELNGDMTTEATDHTDTQKVESAAKSQNIIVV